MEGTQYNIINDVLQHENPNQPGEWRVVVPACLRGELLKELHGGRFPDILLEGRCTAP